MSKRAEKWIMNQTSCTSFDDIRLAGAQISMLPEKTEEERLRSIEQTQQMINKIAESVVG